MNFEHATPTRILFGGGRLDDVGPQARALGTRALVVTGRRAMRASGTLERVVSSLSHAGLRTAVAEVASPDPRADEVDQAVTIARRESCDVVVGLGGGSALDAAKAASVGIEAGPVAPLVGTTLPRDLAALPVVAAPTTAGSGSEVTKGAIITDTARGLKSGIRGEQLFPAVAVVDPEVLATVPRGVELATAWDAFSHAVETYVARRASPLSSVLSEHALDVLGGHLPRLASGERGPELRETLAFAALLGGLTVATASTCLPHRLQQAMGAVPRAEISHGQGLAALYPAWIRHAYPHSARRFDTVANALGGDDINDTVRALRAALELDAGLGAYGFERHDLDTLLAGVTGNVDNDPSPDTGGAVIRDIYESSL